MRFTKPTIALVLLAAFGVNGANAQTAKTREQVKAELAEAIRTGNVPATGDSGMLLNELYPQRYPKQGEVAGKTREQVKAELTEAIRSGDMVATGESGLKLNEEFPSRYPLAAIAPSTVTGSTRAQVKAELAEAIRTGNMIAAGESGLKMNELYPQRYAKDRGVYTAQSQASESAAGAATH